jgi:hypothetical protein
MSFIFVLLLLLFAVRKWLCLFLFFLFAERRLCKTVDVIFEAIQV